MNLVMKKSLLFFVLLLFNTTFYAQDLAVELVKPAAGKSIVYFTRTSSAGLLINFSFYDGEEFIGKLKPGKFIAYECDPGEHIFIGKSENTDYVEANLEANRVYIIDSEGKMGALKVRIKLVPLDKKDKKYEKKKKNILKLISKNKGEIVSIEKDDDDLDDSDETPSKTLKKFYEKKQKNKKITQLTSDMFLDNGA